MGYRFGKTAYGFLSTAIRDTPGDTTLDEVTMSRPIWMSPAYMRKYGASGTPDPVAEDFTTSGQINIRIPGAEARQILAPIYDPTGSPVFGDLNTDSVVSIVVNDGHGGLNTLTRRVFVNVQPQITTTQLVDAIEDEDYNVVLLDSSRTIKVYDPNWGQAHTFELIYASDTRTEIAIDPYFPEAGSIILDATRKTTPDWLKINLTSGLLYGTARVTDLPFEDTVVQVTVLVTDAGNLRDIKTLDLRIVAVNHNPHLFSSPIIKCFDLDEPYSDTLLVSDLDLLRKQAGNEELTFTIFETSGTWVFTPDRLTSPISDTQKIVISNQALNGDIVDGRITVKVIVTDKHGAADTLVYKIAVSDGTRFTADVKVINNFGAYQVLTFGLGGTAIATRGDESGAYGKLDSNYCEYELPPVPYIDVFDARWTIPNRNGILRSIYPFSSDPGEAIYRARFQAGGETGQASNYYPVTVTWCRDEIPAADATNPGSYYIRDDISNGAIFAYNMKTGEGRGAADILHNPGDPANAGPCDTLVIIRDALKGFIIVYDFTTDVNEGEQELSITNVLAVTKSAPNPFTTSTSVTFFTPTSANVKVEVYDAMGSKVVTLADEVFSAGSHMLEWNGASSRGVVASGTYTIRVSDGASTATHQVVLVR